MFVFNFLNYIYKLVCISAEFKWIVKIYKLMLFRIHGKSNRKPLIHTLLWHRVRTLKFVPIFQCITPWLKNSKTCPEDRWVPKCSTVMIYTLLLVSSLELFYIIITSKLRFWPWYKYLVIIHLTMPDVFFRI